MGDPIDPLFSDREAFADFFTRYYTDHEPESALVAEDAGTGEVVGYVLGCVRYRYNAWKQVELIATRIVPKVVLRFLAGRYDAPSRAFLRWVVFRSIRETPPAPERSGHFHVNFLPRYRTGEGARTLLFTFFELAKGWPVRRFYGQIQTRDDRRTTFWTRYGFRELSRRRISKFDAHHPDPIYVTTLFRDFGEG